jgi:predicted amidohydrolase
MAQCLSYFSDIMFEAFFHTMSELAARHRVYIMAGTALYFEGREPRHRAFLFSPDGELAGTQDKLATTRLERALRIQPGSEVLVFDTPMGGVSMLIGSDAEYFETVRAAKSLGAKLILNPATVTGPYTPMDIAGGLNLRVQENSVYGVRSALVGDTGLGVRLEAPCAVFVPNELLRTKGKNGLLAQSSGRDEPDILSVKLDMDVIANIRNPYMHDRNRDLLDQNIDRLY